MTVCSTGPSLKLCWLRPSFYSNDIRGSDTTYNIQLVGDDKVYETTDTFYEFVNVSLCNATFNVSVNASVGGYMSSRVVPISYNNGEFTELIIK